MTIISLKWDYSQNNTEGSWWCHKVDTFYLGKCAVAFGEYYNTVLCYKWNTNQMYWNVRNAPILTANTYKLWNR